MTKIEREWVIKAAREAANVMREYARSSFDGKLKMLRLSIPSILNGHADALDKLLEMVEEADNE